ncbi:MAG: TatD family hydrolase [Anaerolineaceae bacterium]|nr:TatD family hydrolase [Anaerolineaceae bacterium]
MLLLSDTHCHLDLDTFDEDRQGVLDRAWQADVQSILIPEVDVTSTSTAVNLSETDQRIHIAIGVHPNSANTWNNDTLSVLRRLSSNSRVCAIGEIGLDYYRDRSSPELQQDILLQQLALAAEVDNPVIIHCRNAFPALFAVLTEWLASLPASARHLRENPGVLHSFGGDAQQAISAVSAGFFLGINGSITFKNAVTLRSVVQAVGIDHLLLETDAPYITPAPHRGKRNEPSFVVYTNAMLAQMLNISPEHCARITYNNACKLFRW